MNLFVALTTIAVSTASAGPPIKLAAPGLTYVGVEEKTGDFFIDFLAQQLRTHGILVTTRSQIAAVIGLERQKALLGCTESSTECLAELAGALGVDGIVTGSLARTAKGSWVINLTVVNATDGRTVASASTRAKDDDALLDWLTEASRELAPKISSQLRPGSGAATATRPLPMPPPPKPSSSPRPPTSGDEPRVSPPTAQVQTPPRPSEAAVQASAQRPSGPGTRFGLAKWVAGGVGAAALVAGGVFFGLAHSSRGALDASDSTVVTRAGAATALKEIERTQGIGLILAAAGGVGLAVGGALFALDGPGGVQVTLSPSSASIGYSWELP